MDKQMIGEMANDINLGFDIAYDSRSSNFPQVIAEILTEEGYRKIPEGAVVLTDDEYERWQGQTLNIKKVRKETAEKFAEMAKEAIINMKWARDDTHIKLVTQGDCLKAINEILKEITEGT